MAGLRGTKALEEWCKQVTDGYRDVSVKNMTRSFKDGLAFCAIIHHYRPDLVDFDSLSKENVLQNNQLAFRIAEEVLGIPALLDAADMVRMREPDKLCVLTYVSQYYNYFKKHGSTGHGPNIRNNGTVAASDKTSNLQQSHHHSIIDSTTTNSTSAKAYRDTTTKRPLSPSAAATATAGSNNDTDSDQPANVLSNKNKRHNNHSTTTSPSPKSALLSDVCCVCTKKVYIFERHIVNNNLYHRRCFKCEVCGSVLKTGTYIPCTAGVTAGRLQQYECRYHSEEQSRLVAPPQPRQSHSQTPTKLDSQQQADAVSTNSSLSDISSTTPSLASSSSSSVHSSRAARHFSPKPYEAVKALAFDAEIDGTLEETDIDSGLAINSTNELSLAKSSCEPNNANISPHTVNSNVISSTSTKTTSRTASPAINLKISR